MNIDIQIAAYLHNSNWNNSVRNNIENLAKYDKKQLSRIVSRTLLPSNILFPQNIVSQIASDIYYETQI